MFYDLVHKIKRNIGNNKDLKKFYAIDSSTISLWVNAFNRVFYRKSKWWILNFQAKCTTKDNNVVFYYDKLHKLTYIIVLFLVYGLSCLLFFVFLHRYID